jgi:hypothetical protein
MFDFRKIGKKVPALKIRHTVWRSCDLELSSIGQGSFAARPPLEIGATDRPPLEIGASGHVTGHGELQLLVTYMYRAYKRNDSIPYLRGAN